MPRLHIPKRENPDGQLSPEDAILATLSDIVSQINERLKALNVEPIDMNSVKQSYKHHRSRKRNHRPTAE